MLGSWGVPLTLGLQLGEDGLGPAEGGRREGPHPLLCRLAYGLDGRVALLGGIVGGGHQLAGRADEGQAGHAFPHAGLRGMGGVSGPVVLSSRCSVPDLLAGDTPFGPLWAGSHSTLSTCDSAHLLRGSLRLHLGAGHGLCLTAGHVAEGGLQGRGGEQGRSGLSGPAP